MVRREPLRGERFPHPFGEMRIAREVLEFALFGIDMVGQVPFPKFLQQTDLPAHGLHFGALFANCCLLHRPFGFETSCLVLCPETIQSERHKFPGRDGDSEEQIRFDTKAFGLQARNRFTCCGEGTIEVRQPVLFELALFAIPFKHPVQPESEGTHKTFRASPRSTGSAPGYPTSVPLFECPVSETPRSPAASVWRCPSEGSYPRRTLRAR